VADEALIGILHGAIGFATKLSATKEHGTMDETNQSARQQTGSYKGLTRKQRVARAAKMVLSAYRIDQFGDPDGFIGQLDAVFSRYDIEVVEYLTDPRNSKSLQRVHSWPPTIAEVSEACDEETSRRFRVLTETPIRRIQKQYTPPRREPGSRCNMKVEQDVPQYAALKQWAEEVYSDPTSGVGTARAGVLGQGDPTVDACDFKFNADGSVGISLRAWNLRYSEKRRDSTVHTMSDAELRAYYGRKEAEAANKNGDIQDHTEN
jgi:hypothetical protein